MMSLKTEVLQYQDGFEPLRNDWDRLVFGNSTSIHGHDGTSSFVWFLALLDSFPEAKKVKVLVIREHGEVVGLMPVVAMKSWAVIPRLYVLTMLYGGRNGFILKQPREDILIAFLSGLKTAFPRWQSIRMQVVDASESDALLLSACAAFGYQRLNQSSVRTPYFPLYEDANYFYSKMSKGLRQRIKGAPAKFLACGDLDFQEINDPAAHESVIEAILEVEQASWKQAAGSAITCQPMQEKFYRALFPLALEKGLLYGQILRLNAKPIAFNFGLIQSGVFSSLKHSQKTEYERFCASHLLNSEIVNKLRALGVNTYDFMGQSESHKLQWSGDTSFYERHEILIFNASRVGQMSCQLLLTKRRLRDWISRTILPIISWASRTMPPRDLGL
jgi:hypothetical protein